MFARATGLCRTGPPQLHTARFGQLWQQKTPLMPSGMRGERYSAVPLSFVTFPACYAGPAEGICIPRAHGRTFRTAPAGRLAAGDRPSLPGASGILFPLIALLMMGSFYQLFLRLSRRSAERCSRKNKAACQNSEVNRNTICFKIEAENGTVWSGKQSRKQSRSVQK